MKREFIFLLTSLMLIGVLGTASMSQESGTWTQKADMPTARCVMDSAVVDGKIYVIGGAPVNYGATAVVEEYDPATDTWSTRADMPTARQMETVAVVGGIIYVIGGNEGLPAGDRDLSVVEAYDPATDTWTRKADMPAARCGPTSAVVDGIIYVIGGMSATPAGYQADDVEVLSTVEAYDPATDIWTRKADMPTARYFTGACVVDGRIYVSGGITAWKGYSNISTVEIYDPRTDTWTKGADMPRAKWGHTASAVDGKMYIIGGESYELANLWYDGKISEYEMGTLFSIAYMYDPAADTWTMAANIPTSRSWLTAAVVDGKIYAIGGRQDPEDPFLSTVEEYDPGLPGAIPSVR